MTYQQALEYLDAHATYEKTGRIDSPSLGTITQLCTLLGDPQLSAPVIHITGTNGKGSTAQMITRLLIASGLRVGTYTSPHLESINERMAIDGIPISDEDFAEQVAAISDLEMLGGIHPGYFDICTAAAFRWFADQAVEVMVIEVGLLGTWDATNVVDAQVAVITNVGLDHMEFAGPTVLHIAREKSGIIKPRSIVVSGVTDPEVDAVLRQRESSGFLSRSVDFDIDANQLALGGRVVAMRTPTMIYPEVPIPLHGRHQADNAVVAVCAVEAFFARPLSGDVIDEAMSQVVMPGRFEIMGYQPLVIIDGAHNPAGADVCASVFFEDFDPAGQRILVLGCLRGRDLDDMLSAIRAEDFDIVLCCTAPSPRGVPASDLAQAARRQGCENVAEYSLVEKALEAALGLAGPDDAILVAGSLYVVGAARSHLRSVLP